MFESERGAHEFENCLAGLFEVVSHELTHVLTEKPDQPDFTHDPKFYNDQMGILLEPPVPRGLGEEWFEERGKDLLQNT